MDLEELLSGIEKDLAHSESLHHDSPAVKNIVTNVRERIASFRPRAVSGRDFKPILTQEEVYEHIQKVETDPRYRAELEADARGCAGLIKERLPVIADELAKYGVVALVTIPEKKLDNWTVVKLDFLNAQLLYTITPK